MWLMIWKVNMCLKPASYDQTAPTYSGDQRPWPAWRICPSPGARIQNFVTNWLDTHRAIEMNIMEPKNQERNTKKRGSTNVSAGKAHSNTADSRRTSNNTDLP